MSHILFNTTSDGPFFILYRFMDTQTIIRLYLLNKYCNKYIEKYLRLSCNLELIELFSMKLSRYDLFKLNHINFINYYKKTKLDNSTYKYNNSIICERLMDTHNYKYRRYIKYYFDNIEDTLDRIKSLVNKYLKYLFKIKDVNTYKNISNKYDMYYRGYIGVNRFCLKFDIINDIKISAKVPIITYKCEIYNYINENYVHKGVYHYTYI